jgi:hypothetical protein
MIRYPFFLILFDPDGIIDARIINITVNEQ